MLNSSRSLVLPVAALVVAWSGLALSETSRGAPSPRAAVTPMRPTMTLELARAVIDAGVVEAGRLSAGGAIAVVDDGGYLVCLVRLDDTFPAAAEVASAKARTAAIFRKPTKDFEDAVRAGRTTLVAVEPMTPLEGGVPIRIDGVVVGAVGVSGAHSSAEDVQIATAAADALSTLGRAATSD
ncbi:MAG: heme-binding protein [Phycisphaerales bacterium]